MEGKDSIKEILFNDSKYSGIKWSLPIIYNILILFTQIFTNNKLFVLTLALLGIITSWVRIAKSKTWLKTKSGTWAT